MRYLLDVNALVAWAHVNSEHHSAFHGWVKRAGAENLCTCAHSELGFLRVSMQVFGFSLPVAAAALARLKKHTGGFIAVAPPPQLAAWASTAAQTTDAYFVQIARENNLRLATFDPGIRDAVVEHIAAVQT